MKFKDLNKYQFQSMFLKYFRTMPIYLKAVSPKDRFQIVGEANRISSAIWNIVYEVVGFAHIPEKYYVNPEKANLFFKYVSLMQNIYPYDILGYFNASYIVNVLETCRYLRFDCFSKHIVTSSTFSGFFNIMDEKFSVLTLNLEKQLREEKGLKGLEALASKLEFLGNSAKDAIKNSYLEENSSGNRIVFLTQEIEGSYNICIKHYAEEIFDDYIKKFKKWKRLSAKRREKIRCAVVKSMTNTPPKYIKEWSEKDIIFRIKVYIPYFFRIGLY